LFDVAVKRTYRKDGIARLRESRNGIDNESMFASKRITGTVDFTSFAATLSRMLPELERLDDSAGRL